MDEIKNRVFVTDEKFEGTNCERDGYGESMRSIRKGWMAAALLVVGLAAVPSDTRAESGWLNLHLEGGPGFFLTEPQSQWFGVGGGLAFRVDYSPVHWLGIQASFLYSFNPVSDDYDFEAEGYERPEAGTIMMAGGGLRFRILNDQNGYALAWRRGPEWRHEGNLHGNLWLDVGVAYVRTGDLNRFGLEAGLGYEMSLVDGLQLGPYVRYIHVFQPDDELEVADAMILMAGLTFTVAIPSQARTERHGDADGDGILDPYDSCPNDPEDIDQFEDEDGCPDRDNDEDGILDTDDGCPNDPEDIDNFEDGDGCPDPDNDQDGILDVSDGCPDDPEDIDQFEDEDGCPDLDNDEDGIPDIDDECPNEAEVVNGVDDEDGCPDEADIEVVDDDILLRERVYFDFAMARVRGRSWPLLAQIARLLENHPEYALIAIEGHCDEIGPDHVNLRLSGHRANRVRNHLIRRHDIDPDRLRAEGFGRTRPATPGSDDGARQLNRRVEFRIVRIDQSLREGRATPRSGPDVAPDLGRGGVIIPRRPAAPPIPPTPPGPNPVQIPAPAPPAPPAPPRPEVGP